VHCAATTPQLHRRKTVCDSASAWLTSCNTTVGREELSRARTLAPNINHQWFGWYFLSVGQRERADREFERFAVAQPLLVYANATYGKYCYLTRRYDRAIAQLKYTLEMDPWAARAHELLGITYEQLGQTRLAESDFKIASELSNGNCQSQSDAKI
jgi:tetratricopeptide (TPR) repeat protein